jgi:hypothetical protein
MSKSQVRNRGASAFFAVIGKVCLHVLIGVASNDSGGCLVSAYRAIGTQTPELAGDGFVV